MTRGIIRFAVGQRLLVMRLVAVMVGIGVYSLTGLPLDAVPDVTNVQVQVLTSAPALAAVEVERQITFPVEVAMSGLPGITELRSLSLTGLSAVTVVFTDATDIYAARQLVLERLSQAREEIPSAIGSPEIGPIATGLGDIYQYELRAAGGSPFDLMALRTIQDWSVRRVRGECSCSTRRSLSRVRPSDAVSRTAWSVWRVSSSSLTTSSSA